MYVKQEIIDKVVRDAATMIDYMLDSEEILESSIVAERVVNKVLTEFGVEGIEGE
jgi:hypothetical protein